jgi:hypothetical protein
MEKLREEVSVAVEGWRDSDGELRRHNNVGRQPRADAAHQGEKALEHVKREIERLVDRVNRFLELLARPKSYIAT